MDGDDNIQPEHPTGEATVAAPIEGQEIGVIGSTGSYNSVLYHHPEALLHQGQGQGSNGEPSQQNSILFAQQVMNANTTQLNTQEEMDRSVEGNAYTENKGRSWSERTNSLLGKFKR